MKKSDMPTRLLVSGNINEWKKSLYYNVQYCRIVEDNAADSMNIEMDGQWLDSSRLRMVDGQRTDTAMNQEEIDKWMLEYEIISS